MGSEFDALVRGEDTRVERARAWWGVRRGHHEPIPPIPSVVLAGTPSVTVTRRPPSVPMLWVARLLWATPVGLLFSLVMAIVENNRELERLQPMDDMSAILYVMGFGALLIGSAIALTLSSGAYRVVRRGSAVARGMVLGCALIVFTICGAAGWGMIIANRGVSGLRVVGGVPILAIALAGIGAVVWYFVRAPSGRDRLARSGAADP